MFITNRFSVSCGMTGCGNNGQTPQWYGFYYGSWLPRFHSNGGTRGQVRDYGWHWLCFHGSVTLWP